MSSWDDYRQTMVAPRSLWAAAKENDVKEIESLLAAGAAIDERDARGHSALMLAAYNGHGEAFDLLLASGADPNSVDLGGNSVLMGAAFKGHREMVTQLLAAGADPTLKNHAGLDARGFAETFGRVGVASLLDASTASNGRRACRTNI